MKYLFALMIAVSAVACRPNPANYSVPVGYKTCSSDLDCPRGTYCGFVHVDTYAVCRNGGSDNFLEANGQR